MNKNRSDKNLENYVPRPALESKVKRFLDAAIANEKTSSPILYIWGLGGAGKTWLTKAVFARETEFRFISIFGHDQALFYSSSRNADAEELFIAHRAIENIAEGIRSEEKRTNRSKMRRLKQNLFPKLPLYNLLHDYGISRQKTANKITSDAPIVILLTLAIFALLLIILRALESSPSFGWLFVICSISAPSLYGLFHLRFRRLVYGKRLARAGLSKVFALVKEATEDTDETFALRDPRSLHANPDYLLSALRNDIGRLFRTGKLSRKICLYIDLDYFPDSRVAEKQLLDFISSLSNISQNRDEESYARNTRLIVISKRRKSFVSVDEASFPAHPSKQYITPVRGMSESESRKLVYKIILAWNERNFSELSETSVSILLRKYYEKARQESNGKKVRTLAGLMDTGLLDRVERLPASIRRRTISFLEDHGSEQLADINLEQIERELKNDRHEALFRGHSEAERKKLEIAACLVANGSGLPSELWDQYVREQYKLDRQFFKTNNLIRYESLFFLLPESGRLEAKTELRQTIQGDRLLLDRGREAILDFVEFLLRTPQASGPTEESLSESETISIQSGIYLTITSFARAFAQHNALLDSDVDKIVSAVGEIFAWRSRYGECRNQPALSVLDENLFKLSLEILASSGHEIIRDAREDGQNRSEIGITIKEYIIFYRARYFEAAIFEANEYYPLLLHSAIYRLAASDADSTALAHELSQALQNMRDSLPRNVLSGWFKLDDDAASEYALYDFERIEKNDLASRARHALNELKLIRTEPQYIAESQQRFYGLSKEYDDVLAQIDDADTFPIYSLYEIRKLSNSIIDGLSARPDASNRISQSVSDRFMRNINNSFKHRLRLDPDCQDPVTAADMARVILTEIRFRRFAEKTIDSSNIPASGIQVGDCMGFFLKHTNQITGAANLNEVIFKFASALSLGVSESEEIAKHAAILYVEAIFENLRRRHRNRQQFPTAAAIPEEQAEFDARVDGFAQSLASLDIQRATQELLGTIYLSARNSGELQTGDFVVGKVEDVIWDAASVPKPKLLLSTGNFNNDKIVLDNNLMPTKIFTQLVSDPAAAEKLTGTFLLTQLLTIKYYDRPLPATARGGQFCGQVFHLLLAFSSSWKNVPHLTLGGSNSVLTIGLGERYFQLMVQGKGVISKFVKETMQLNRIVLWPQLDGLPSSLREEMVERYNIKKFSESMYRQMDVYFNEENEILFLKRTPGIDPRFNRTFLSAFTKNFGLPAEIFGWNDPGRGYK